MKQTRLLMNMPITIEIVDIPKDESIFDEIYEYFRMVEDRFSTFRRDSEISRINSKKNKHPKHSHEMKEIFDLAEKTKRESFGYFDIERKGHLDPSGIVKGWAIFQAAKKLQDRGIKNFYIEAGGDIQTYGVNNEGSRWQVGIRNPFNYSEMVKTVELSGEGIATSGNYYRGQHIYNPLSLATPLAEIVSITVIGSNVLEADRFATAAFAMGKDGINFIESKQEFEGYMIDQRKVATFTNSFERYVK